MKDTGSIEHYHDSCFYRTLLMRLPFETFYWSYFMECLLSIFYMLFQKGGGTIDLEPRLSHTSAVEPTLAPVAVERTMTTRAAASVIFF